jgi:hypothetical protein
MGWKPEESWSDYQHEQEILLSFLHCIQTSSGASPYHQFTYDSKQDGIVRKARVLPLSIQFVLMFRTGKV